MLTRRKHFAGTVSLPSSSLPVDITEEWFNKLPLLQPPGDDCAHYSGRELMTTLKQLTLRMERDDPQEEFKVREGRGSHDAPVDRLIYQITLLVLLCRNSININ